MEQHTLGTFTWIQMADPGPDDLRLLRDEFGVPSFTLEVALRSHARTRLESSGDRLLLVLKPAVYRESEEAIEVGQLVVIARTDAVITLGDGARNQLDGVVRALEADATRLQVGPAAMAHAIVAEVVDGYATVLDELDADVDEIEAQVFSEQRGSHAERIYRLKSEVQAFRRAAGPLPDELDELLETRDRPESFGVLTEQFGDLRARALRVAEHVSHLDELLNSVLSAHLAQIGIQQNNDMRRISAWVAIVAAPTAMSSIYGMNFRHMPELQWRYGYAAVLVVMASVCLLLYRLFKRSGWL